MFQFFISNFGYWSGRNGLSRAKLDFDFIVLSFLFGIYDLLCSSEIAQEISIIVYRVLGIVRRPILRAIVWRGKTLRGIAWRRTAWNEVVLRGVVKRGEVRLGWHSVVWHSAH